MPCKLILSKSLIFKGAIFSIISVTRSEPKDLPSCSCAQAWAPLRHFAAGPVFSKILRLSWSSELAFHMATTFDFALKREQISDFFHDQQFMFHAVSGEHWRFRVLQTVKCQGNLKLWRPRNPRYTNVNWLDWMDEVWKKVFLKARLWCRRMILTSLIFNGLQNFLEYRPGRGWNDILYKNLPNSVYVFNQASFRS